MTTKDEALSLEEAIEGVNRLRWAIHPFSGHPMAQRRWAQMGHVQSSCALLLADAGRIDGYVAAGAATPEQGRQVTAVAEALRAVTAQRTDVFYDEVSAPRTFLWTTAFEEDEWSDLRAKARAIFGSLSEGKAALIASGSA
jgi:hypothetical protein